MNKKFFLLTSVIAATACLSGALLQAADGAGDEKALQKSMKDIGSVMKGFKKNLDEKNGEAVAKDATRVAEIYKGTLGFWKSRHFDDAAKWSEESATAATATAAAAKAGDWDKVKTSWGPVSKNCKSCHEAHREKEGDVYKVK